MTPAQYQQQEDLADVQHQFAKEQEVEPTQVWEVTQKSRNSGVSMELLDDLEEFLDGQADAEYFPDSPSPVGNTAMKLYTRLKQERKT